MLFSASSKSRAIIVAISWPSLLACQGLFAQGASSPIISGHRDFTYSGGNVTSGPTEEKPESKLWYADGRWWAIMWSSAELRYRIHRLDMASQSWLDTGVDVDNRGRSSQDVYWEGSTNTLYIASQAKTTAVNGSLDARLYRYSYNSASQSYTLDVGFPSVIYSNKSFTLVIARDSIGNLWATWTHLARVWISRSTDDGQTWGTPFELPGQGNDLQIDPNDPAATEDISSIIEFGGGRIGVLWSNQLDGRYYFSVHLESEPDPAVWQTRETAFEDATLPNAADDHVNLATSNDGHVLAVIKHGANVGSQPLVTVIKRDPATGVWSSAIFGRRTDQHTRGIVLFDSDTDSVYVFASSESFSPGSVYYKTAHLSALNFSPGLGRVFVRSFTADDRINNPTSTKQPVNGTTGLLVLASDENGPTRYYFHNNLALGGNARPVAVDDATSVPMNTPTAINVLANDGDDGAIDVTSVQIVTHPTSGTVTADLSTGVVTYTGNSDFSGNDSFTYTITDNQGENAVAATVAVAVQSGRVPLQVELQQNYPNPFNATTVIFFFVSNTSNITLEVFNIKGQRIRTLHDGQIMPGLHRVEWDGTDAHGVKVVSGSYLYCLRAREHAMIRKLLLVK